MDMMNWLLPAWIIGAPVVALIADWMFASKNTSFSNARSGYIGAVPA